MRYARYCVLRRHKQRLYVQQPRPVRADESGRPCRRKKTAKCQTLNGNNRPSADGEGWGFWCWPVPLRLARPNRHVGGQGRKKGGAIRFGDISAL